MVQAVHTTASPAIFKKPTQQGWTAHQYEPERIAPSPKPRKQYAVKYDSKGRAIPPRELIDKYRSMNEDQRRRYYRWREQYYGRHPDLKDSEKRFPIVDKAIDAIRKGKEPPKP